MPAAASRDSRFAERPSSSAQRYLDSAARARIERLLAAVALLALSPLLAFVGLLIVLVDGSPMLFRQERIGRSGQPFTLLKFRTMVPPEGHVAGLLDGGARTTRLGRILRRTSIDELPALANILRGDMSIVGPRPLLPHHLPLYRTTHPDRLLARPGLTGLAQISGRRALTFQERLDLDVTYVRSASALLDVRIVVRTIRTVLAGIGASSEGGLEAVDDIGLAEAINASQGPAPWEHGSFLQPHGPIGSEAGGVPPRDAALAERVVFGTARQAIIAIAQTANRLFVPTYYCPDVVEALKANLAADIVRYVDHPWAGASEVVVDAGDLVIVLPHFGRPTGVTVAGGTLVIDATHTFGREGLGLTTDAAGRPADMCFASLRKTLPVPDGSVVWSPLKAPLPPRPALSDDHASRASDLAEALEDKAALLRRERTDGSDVYPRLASSVAALEASCEPSAALPGTIGDLSTFDLRARWARRDANRAAAIAHLERLGVVGPGAPLEVLDAPFMLVLIASTAEDRDRLRTGLIARDVYPAVLWPHDHSAEGSPERDFGERMLAIHVDARYSPADLARVAVHIHAVCSEDGLGR